MSTIRNPLELLAQDPIQLSLVSVKSKLMIIITKLIREKCWTQAQAAKEFGISQPRISNLMNGQISKFSIDMLLEMLGHLGYLLDIKFNPEDDSNPIKMDIKKTAV
ncbi:helix-turn-helix domain-containing protein [Vibrio cholerae]|uniref:helix-turn-helix domain-containing protein n=1 Tax=Vibrio TaxID=662 RepID=UPI001C30241B|nr:helix-turn-helix transcriptional regulator [Vibrio metschnikovii]EJK2417453.1 XRE family transcriptional regulator [Vibrio cholerae]EKF9252541.1 XRE family transcriptional regulator [Vibrio cholerae]ELE1940859.1 XRE family transcriptional regulator [Vibrio cholerae]ELJ8465983.1 XRE family transcriptional regulator [Vibrio cholerae]EMA2410597.1 XRE family transcriptional regulator [Vibrio cholerae]